MSLVIAWIALAVSAVAVVVAIVWLTGLGSHSKTQIAGSPQYNHGQVTEGTSFRGPSFVVK